MASSKTKNNDTRSKILEAALDLFSEKGFHASTTRKISQKAGVNEVTLFRHFKTKLTLFEEVLNEINRAGFDSFQVLEGIDFEIDPAEAIRMAVEYTFEIFEKNPRETRLLLLALLERVEGFEDQYVNKNRNNGITFLSDAFAKLQEQNRITSKELPDMLAQLLLSQAYEMATQWAMLKHSPLKKYKRATIIESILKLYLS